jgi:signal transduction histidine kinase/CheY-like chemotaxis protein
VDELRRHIERVSDMLCRTIGGNFDLTLSAATGDESVDKLCLLVNFVLDNCRRSLAELTGRHAELAELDRLKTEFFANMSHELRTPLTLILGPLSTLLCGDHGPLSPGVRDVLERMQRNASRLTLLVDDLLDFAKLEAKRMKPRPQAVDLCELVGCLASEVQDLARQRGVKLLQTGALAHPLVQTDPRLVDKILLNLLSNALKFTPAGGTVTLGLSETDSTLDVAVGDTGIGIPDGELEKIFERFRQADGQAAPRPKGTGLGLAIVKELAMLLDARLTVTSAVGAGSAFTLHLPRTQVASRPALPAQARRLPRAPWQIMPELSIMFANAGADGDELGAPPVDAPRVLVADDNPDMRDYVARILGSEARVTAVAGGVEALAQLEAKPFDVLVCDVMMPEFDGLELTRRLKASARHRHLPILLLTALAGADAAAAGLDAGADDYLVKPFGAAELRSRVRAALRTRRLRRELAHARGELQLRGAEAPARPAAAARRLEDLRVLLVDDEADARELVSFILRRQGAVVTTAGSAAEALRELGAKPFDLLVSDIGMPGADGCELLRSLRAERAGATAARVPALALTAYTREEERQRILGAGFQRHVAKPVDPAQLIAAIAATVGPAGQGDPKPRR